MTSCGASAAEHAKLTKRNDDIREELRRLQAEKKEQERNRARIGKNLFSVALCVLAVSGSRIEILDRYWRQYDSDDSVVQRQTGEVVNHYLALEPVAVARILDAETTAEARALKKALSFVIHDETFAWVLSQNKGKGVAPSRKYVLETRERLVQKMQFDASRTVMKKLKSKTSGAAKMWYQRWKLRCGISKGAFQARKVLSATCMQTKVPELHRAARNQLK